MSFPGVRYMQRCDLACSLAYRLDSWGKDGCQMELLCGFLDVVAKMNMVLSGVHLERYSGCYWRETWLNHQQESVTTAHKISCSLIKVEGIYIV